MRVSRSPETTDVIVVGAGAAGMAAVSAAANLGVDVVAIESGDAIGGNAIWSTGYVAFVGSAMQKEAGITDNEEIFMDDSARVVGWIRHKYGVIWDQNLTRQFARQSAETYRILYERGVRFSRFIPRPMQHSVDRMVAVFDTRMFAAAFEPDFASPNVTTLFSTTAQRLLTEHGRVVGVRAMPRRLDDAGNESFGEAIEIRARQGVVLCTGGYQANPMLRRRYQPEYLSDTPYPGVDTCRGDGHLMGSAIGGDLINMTIIPPLVAVASSFVEEAIAVNRSGKRFHDEAGPYDNRVDALKKQPDRWGCYIIDSETAESKATFIAQMPEAPISAPTIRELAVLIGSDPGAIEATVAGWNVFLAGDGAKDPDFARVVLPPERRGILKPPFFAIPMKMGTNMIAGGFTVTEAMQVVSVFGEAIPGLYAAGDTVGGLNPVSDLGGIHLAGGFTLGRIAGQSAARGVHANKIEHNLQGAKLPGQLERMALVNLAGAR